jgi:uncharacterized protein (TIGR02246 family)
MAANDAEAIIRRIGNQWSKHWNAKELDQVVAAYAEDAVYMPPHHAAVHGREAIREYLKGPLAHGVTDLTYDVTYIRQSGDLAYDVGRYTMTIPQKDGGARKDEGKYLVVWKKQPNEEWRIAADCWSSDLPPAH